MQHPITVLFHLPQDPISVDIEPVTQDALGLRHIAHSIPYPQLFDEFLSDVFESKCHFIRKSVQSFIIATLLQNFQNNSVVDQNPSSAGTDAPIEQEMLYSFCDDSSHAKGELNAAS